MFHRFSPRNPLCCAFKAASVAIVLSGCTFGNRKEDSSHNLTPELQHRTKNFEEILKFCKANFEVRDFKKFGSNTVIILSDIHNQRIEFKNSEQLKKLHTGVDLDAVAFEGYFVKDAPSVFQELKEILSRHPEKVFNESKSPPLVFSERSYAALKDITFSNVPYVTLEKEQKFIDAEISEIWKVNLEGLLQSIEHGETPAIAIDGKNVRAFQDILNCQEYLKNSRSPFPQISLSIFPSKNTPQGMVLYGDKSTITALKASLEKYESWYSVHVIQERNHIASSAMINFHLKKENSCSAIVFGADHTHSQGQRISIQRYLSRANVSYIVIDPYPWEKMNQIWPARTRSWRD